MGRRRVEVEIVFLDVFAVIALAVGQTEQPLFEDRVLAVPQSEGEAKPLMIVAETGEAILAPMIGARTGLVMGEVVPRIAVLAVVLADGAPLAFAEIWPPKLPQHALLSRFVETQLLRCLGAFCAYLLGHSVLLHVTRRLHKFRVGLVPNQPPTQCDCRLNSRQPTSASHPARRARQIHSLYLS